MAKAKGHIENYNRQAKLHPPTRRMLKRAARELDPADLETSQLVDVGRSVYAGTMFNRPHSCFRSSMDAVEFLWPESAYVEGWLSVQVVKGGLVIDRYREAHGWLELAGQVVDAKLAVMVLAVTGMDARVRLEWQALGRWTWNELQEVRPEVGRLRLPLLERLRDVIWLDEMMNRELFERIAARQGEYDRGRIGRDSR